MFSSRPGTDIVVRALLIAVILCNALLPEAALALPSSGREGNPLPSTNGADTEQSNGLVAQLSSLFQISLQDSTPTIPPTETETPTPESTSTPSSFPESTPTHSDTPENTLTPTFSTPEITQTPLPSQTPAPTQTSLTSAEIPQLSIGFSAEPNNPRIGDRVTFTLEIRNDGISPSTGLAFSNFLPDGFIYVEGGNDEFTLDPHTQELTWTINPEMPLMPGEKLILEYTVVITPSEADDIQIIDTANIRANGLAEPVAVETSLLLSQPGNSLTTLDARGGKAIGVDGHVELDFPERSLVAQRVISIRDLREQKSSPEEEGELWIVFELGLRIPEFQDAQVQASPEMNDTTSEETPATILQQAVTPVPSDETPSQESDSLTPLMPVDAEFDEPVELIVSLDGIIDLATLGAEMQPFLVTLDEDSQTWVRIPLKAIDRETNRITAELTHFSTWGVGIGPSFPQNGANVLLFDTAYPSLFTGRSNYSIPIWTPAGRNGMQPDLALSYSSGSVDGVLGDVQAPWVGMGWNIDSVEIARKITNGGCNPCGSGSYGYENKFLLLFNGKGYELIPNGTTPDRYHTKEESFLYIQRHNDVLGNPSTPSTENTTGEWWEVVEKDGTRWRLGWRADAEQLAAMKGYPGSATGAWSTLGYAGHASHVVASRWRVDRVTDRYGNQMWFMYEEESRSVAGTTASYDRASYLDEITYTGHVTHTPTVGYSMQFIRESRSGSDLPSVSTEWDNWESDRLDRIEVIYNGIVVRKYDLSYQVRSYSDGGVSWQTTVLTSMSMSGSTTLAPIVNTTAPNITFTYTDMDNRAANGSGSNEWAYPRLVTINNGWGGGNTYVYENDGRPYTSWYNWRVNELRISDGVSDPMKTTFSYVSACYMESGTDWCGVNNIGTLAGYGQTTTTSWRFNGTIRDKTVHKFHTVVSVRGHEYESLFQDASGTTLRKTFTQFGNGWVSGYPEDVYFMTPDRIDEFVYINNLVQIRTTTYMYDYHTGNLYSEKQYDGSHNLYRWIQSEYVTNPDPTVWILNTISRRTVSDGAGVVLSEQQYGYNGNLPEFASGDRT